MGQPMVVINKTGAAGSLAAAEIISSRPDGYKLTTQTNQFFASAMKMQKVPFNPDDLSPIANFMEFRNGLVVKADSPWKTLDDLLNYTRKNPGLRWGHSGRGTSLHIGTLYIFKKAGVQTVDIPYKGTPEILTALLGGHLDAASIPYGSTREQVRAGQVRYLTFYSDLRFNDQPTVPSVTELGFPDAAKLTALVAVYVHRNTPESIKKYLMQVSKQIYDDPRFKKLPDFGGEDPRFGGPQFVVDSIKKAEEVAVPIIKELGLYVK